MLSKWKFNLARREPSKAKPNSELKGNTLVYVCVYASLCFLSKVIGIYDANGFSGSLNFSRYL